MNTEAKRTEAHWEVVHRSIALVALQVLVAVLDGGDAEDDQERQGGQSRGDIAEAWEELQNDQNCSGASVCFQPAEQIF
jgi:hypothetical protein